MATKSLGFGSSSLVLLPVDRVPSSSPRLEVDGQSFSLSLSLFIDGHRDPDRDKPEEDRSLQGGNDCFDSGSRSDRAGRSGTVPLPASIVVDTRLESIFTLEPV